MAQPEIQKVTARELGNYSGAMSVVGYPEEPQNIPHALDYRYVSKSSSNGAEAPKATQFQKTIK